MIPKDECSCSKPSKRPTKGVINIDSTHSMKLVDTTDGTVKILEEEDDESIEINEKQELLINDQRIVQVKQEHSTAPFMITPMNFDLDELNRIIDDNNIINHNNNNSNEPNEDLIDFDQLDLYMAPNCILGDCPCGESCSCPGCPIHDPSVVNHTVT
jgi:hypothetical protein